MSQATTETPALLANFEGIRNRLATAEPDWVRRLRRAGFDRFAAIGFPTTRQEEWRSTNVGPIVKTAFQPGEPGTQVSADDLPAAGRLDLGGPRLVFVDGRFVEKLSRLDGLPDGVWAGSLARALQEIPDRVRSLLERRDPAGQAAFCALNAAYHEDGAVLLVPADVSFKTPVQLLFASTGATAPTASHPRNLIHVARGARAQVVESYFGIGEGLYLTNALTDSFVEDNAQLDHYRLQLESPRAFHVSTFASHQTRDSLYTSHNFNLGGALVRHDVVGVLDGPGAECRMNGLYLTDAEQRLDNQTVLDHAKPNGSSREVYKGILDGKSRAVFNGRIIVREDAQKTDAKQSNPNLLVSAHALVQTRPQLEIYADDVKCTHGATVGRLSEDAVFYLRSRGLPEAQARDLLIEAFAGEVLEQIEIASLREYLDQAVARKLPGRNG